MVILVFRGSKGEDLEVFLREYKRACIGTRFRTTIEWLNFFPEFLECTTSHWFEQYIETLNESWNDITKAIVKKNYVKNVY
jgi:hypothetical protein